MPLPEHALVAFLRRVLTADKARAQRTRIVRPFAGTSCPRCDRTLDGSFSSTTDPGAAVNVGHDGDPSAILGCPLTDDEFTAISDGGITEDAADRIVDLDSKLAIVDLCAPPLVETTGPLDSEQTFIPGE